MVGGALVALLRKRGFTDLLTPSRSDLDLTDQGATYDYLRAERPEVVVVAAAKVGGILANSSYPASFLQENLAIALNLIHGSHLSGIDRLLFLGSSCIYPKLAPMPLREAALLTGPLEPTNEGYAIAKIVGVKLVEYYAKEYGRSYISAMPTNLYGPGDRYDERNSHVVPALLQRFHRAKEESQEQVKVWGSGRPLGNFSMWRILPMRSSSSWRTTMSPARSISVQVRKFRLQIWPR